MRISDWSSDVCSSDLNVKFVCYPISAQADRAGQSLVNWVAELRRDQPRAAETADWTAEGSRDFIAAFAGFRMPDIDIPRLLHDTAQITQYPMIDRSEEHTSELQSLMRISYAVFCLKKK